MQINFCSNSINYLTKKQVQKPDNLSGLKTQPSFDQVTFGLRSQPFLHEILDEIHSTSSGGWKKFRKCDSKISSTRMLDHPKFGKVKIGLTMGYRKDLEPEFLNGHNVKAFIEIPKHKISTATINTDSNLFQLAQRVIGNETYSQFKVRADKEQELSLRKYDEMTKPFKRKKERHKLSLMA
jgi:hypothetical protein